MNKERCDEIVYKGMVFYFRVDRENFLWLETDGIPMEREHSSARDVIMEVKQFLLDNQTEDDKEFQSVLEMGTRSRLARGF